MTTKKRLLNIVRTVLLGGIGIASTALLSHILFRYSFGKPEQFVPHFSSLASQIDLSKSSLNLLTLGGENAFVKSLEAALFSVAYSVPGYFAALFLSYFVAGITFSCTSEFIKKATLSLVQGFSAVSLVLFALASQYFLAYKLGWFPLTYSYKNQFASTLLCGLTLCLYLIPTMLIRFHGMIEQEYLESYHRVSRSKGASHRRIVFRHIPRNLLPHFVSMMTYHLPAIAFGAFIIEDIFSVPGYSSLILSAIRNADISLLTALVIVSVTFYVVIQTIYQSFKSDGSPDAPHVRMLS
ncbi:MAG: hypothetical protein COT74_10075 [Bdellovibrionales bacterium CG10_big_fil_rev_8_21_14_0_10_45_34]|nr:MAG: hypothetical protein COT74_10075 [Bdellovibrionales bacterium CG10_big_fil_rev_8_21_14_0_10_45_34]